VPRLEAGTSRKVSGSACCPLESQDKEVSIVTGVWLGGRGVRILVIATDSSVLQKLQTGPGAHPAPHAVGTGVSLPGRKRLQVRLRIFIRQISF
jgi:hypothetical protein